MLGDLSAQCPFCAGTRLRKFHAIAANANVKRTINISECLNCELAWQWPLHRSETESVAYFEKEYESNAGYFEAEATAKRCALQLEFVNRSASVGSLLDIGAGSGAFVKAAATAGWEATGLEPAGTPFHEGRAKLVRCGVEDLLTSEVFDVATLFDVVEHVPDYVSLLHAVSKHIKVCGSIVIETGNYQSLNRLRDGLEWWGYQEDHRWYLAPGVLYRQLADLGFERFTLCERVLRPQSKAGGDQPISFIQVLPGIIKRPWRAFEKIARYRSEQTAASKWPDWFHLGIFTIVASKKRRSDIGSC